MSQDQTPMDSAITVTQIRSLLTEKLQATEIEVQDDSHRHAGHRGKDVQGGHFTVRVVSAQFVGQTLLQQHQLVYAALEEIRPQIHALSLQTQVP